MNYSEAFIKRCSEVKKSIVDRTCRTGDYQEFYEESSVEEVERFEIKRDGFKDETIVIEKMCLTYTQNWDENDRRVKKGGRVTGSIYYVAYAENAGEDCDEDLCIFKTKADAIKVAQNYINELNNMAF